jgi:hypothetical protein
MSVHQQIRKENPMTRPRSAILTTGLRKSFGDHVVLDGVDLDVAEGTIFALLGPNGAGKTTIVQILSTLIGADGGTLRVAGHDPAGDPDAVRAAIGVTGQFSAVDNLLTGEENLILMADLHHLWAGAKAAGARATCSSDSTWSRRPGSRSPPTPEACGAGSTSRWASSVTRGSSSSTSRPRASTRAAGAPCGRSSATSPRAGSRSS